MCQRPEEACYSQSKVQGKYSGKDAAVALKDEGADQPSEKERVAHS